MLTFFSANQTTTILETTKVRKILQGDMVHKGGFVLVDLDKKNSKQLWLSYMVNERFFFVNTKIFGFDTTNLI